MSYQSAVLADSPAGYWRLDEPSGSTMADSSGNARNGTYPGGLTGYGAAGALQTSTNDAFAFVSTAGDYATVADNAAWSIPTTGSLTIELWAKVASLPAAQQVLLSKFGAGSTKEWELRISSAGVITCYFTNADDSVPRGTVTVGTIATGSFYHIVVTVSGTTVTGYLNAVAGTPITLSGSTSNTASTLDIARRSVAPLQNFNGTLDEVAIYPTALSAARVSAHYLAALSYSPPTITIEYAPGFSPLNTPTEPDWVDVGTRCRSFSFRRGRQDDLAEFEAGSALITLDGSDGLVDPLESTGIFYGNDAIPYTPVRIVANWDGLDYVRWSGFMLDGPRPVDLGRSYDMLFELECVDFLGWAASIPLSPNQWGLIVEEAEPYTWIGGEATLTPATDADPTRLWNYGTSPDDYKLIAASGVLVLDPGLPPNDNDSAFHLGSSSGTTYVSSTVDPPVTSDWACALWFQTTNITTFRDLVVGNAPGGVAWVVTLNANGTLNAQMRNGAGAAVASATTNVSFLHDDGATHLLYAQFSRTGASSSVQIYSDLDTTGATASGATALESGGNNIQLCEADAGTLSPIVDDFVMWNSSTHPTFTDATWTAISVVDDTSSAWLNDTMSARVARWLDVAGVAGAAVEVSDSMGAILNPVITKSNLADALKAVSASTLGATWITKEGAIRVRDALALTDATNYADEYVTQWAALTDEPSPASSATIVVVSKRSRTGTRVDRVINDVQIRGNDGLIIPLLTRVLDRASQALYGRRPFELDTEIKRSVFTVEMPAQAQDIIDRFAAPPLEVGELVIEPWGNSEHTQFVVADLELERAVHYTETVPGTSNVILDGVLRIQSEAWDWSDGDRWSVTVVGSLTEYNGDVGVVSGKFAIGTATTGRIGRNRIG